MDCCCGVVKLLGAHPELVGDTKRRWRVVHVRVKIGCLIKFPFFCLKMEFLVSSSWFGGFPYQNEMGGCISKTSIC